MTSLAARIAGVVKEPRTTLAAVAANPRWAGVLMLTTLVTFVSSALLFKTEVGRFALVDQWERTAIAFGQHIDDAQYDRFEALSANGMGYAALTALLSGPILTLAVTLVLTLVARGVLRSRASFRQLLAMVAYAGVILTLRQVITAPLNYASETLASPTTLVRVVSALDETSPLARFLGVIDLFVVWWIVVLAIGVAVIGRRPARPLALAFTGAYVALALLLALAMAVSGGAA
ncbi:MAG: YIP1 family protein [Vicinamibacterales bacterium]